MRNDKPLVAGEIARVKSLEAILATLDSNGSLDGMPFMPEMARYCGREFKVYQRAHKFCIENGDMGTMPDAVFLEEVRCDGSAHKSCGRGCLIFWKDAWLERPGEQTETASRKAGITLEALQRRAVGGDTYYCQSTEIMHASKLLPWWKVGQYVEDLFCARHGVTNLAKSLFVLFGNKVRERRGQPALGSVLGSAKTAPRVTLGLNQGELVRVKTLDEIKSTLDRSGKNRGLMFTPQMASYCGKTFRVSHRVENLVLEHTPKSRGLKDTVVLEGLVCDGMCRRLCMRRSYHLWREAWLERLEPAITKPDQRSSGCGIASEPEELVADPGIGSGEQESRIEHDLQLPRHPEETGRVESY